MKDLRQMLKPAGSSWGVLALGLALACLAASANFALLLLSGWLLAGAAVAGSAGIAAQNLFNFFLPASGVRFFATLRILSRYAERLITHAGALRLISQVRVQTLQRLIPRSSLLLGTGRSGDLLNRLVADTEKLGQCWTDGLLPWTTALLSGLLSVAVVAFFSPAMGLVLLLALVLATLPIPLVSYWRSAAPERTLNRIEERLRGDSVEALRMMEDVRLGGAKDFFYQRLAAAQSSLSANYWRKALIGALAEQGLALLVLLSLLAVLLLGARGLASGQLSSAQLPMLVLGCLGALAPTMPLARAAQALAATKAAGERIRSLTQVPVPVPLPRGAGPIPANPAAGLALRDIHLSYPGSGRKILRGLSLRVAAGERLGIVGPSGSGKSSLLRMLARLIDFQEGGGRLAGVDLKALDTQALSAWVGVLAQDFHLFQGSIRHNLALACPGVDDGALWEALGMVQLDGEIRGMGQGLDSFAGSLSGGQARRLAIAQLILRRPHFLLLDEPTESLPPALGEALLQDLLAVLPQATVICISHRQEPLRFMDRVLRMDGGRLVAAGSRGPGFPTFSAYQEG